MRKDIGIFELKKRIEETKELLKPRNNCGSFEVGFGKDEKVFLLVPTTLRWCDLDILNGLSVEWKSTDVSFQENSNSGTYYFAIDITLLVNK